MIALRNAYHGMSIATMGTCGQHTWKQPMPQVSWHMLHSRVRLPTYGCVLIRPKSCRTPASCQGFGVHHALNPDPYRGVFGDEGRAYAEDVKDLIRSATPGKVCGQLRAGQGPRAQAACQGG
jgi:alanine-glyoxylate transaminase/(R)-3-amino-2-methylpropionate-pyruvate transaminase